MTLNPILKTNGIKRTLFFLYMLFMSSVSYAQATNTYTDEELQYKKVKEHIAKEEYAFAYPLVKDLKQKYKEDRASDHSYINDDINYYNALCELKFLQEIGKDDAEEFINSTSNEPRKEILSFHLAHYYFLKNEYAKAVDAYNDAGYKNLSNDQIADAKFEKAYCQFNLKRYDQAKDLFNEIHQLPKNKYYIPANYYYGFISYYEKQYAEALKAFKMVETYDEYKNVVPYYIAEIYYFQGNKEKALSYGEDALNQNSNLVYDDQLRLLIGQMYFEKKNYSKALPLLEAYVNANKKVSKEIMYELSYCYYSQGFNAKAIEGFKQLSNEKDSMGQNSMYLLGDLYLKQGDKANARSAFQYSAYNSSNMVQQKVSLFNYAKLSYELGFQNIALAEIKNYLKQYPNSEYDVEAREILVALLARTSNYTDALATYKTIAAPTATMQKIYPTIIYGKAIEELNDQKIQAADDLFAKVIADNNAGSKAGYANFWRGEIAYRLQNYDAASKYLATFLQADLPAQGEANATAAKYNLGYSKFQKEQYADAANWFEQVAKSVTTTSTAQTHDAYIRSGDCYYMLKDYTKANSIYDGAIKASSPLSDYAMYQQAMIAGIKNGADKIKVLSNVLKQYPNTSLAEEINMQIALTHIANTKFMDAVPYLNTIINATNSGMKPAAYLKLGLSYYNANNNTEALKAYNKLIKTYPQSVEADEAMDIVKSIYVEEGKSDEYVVLMNQIGKAVSVTEADSLSYTSAIAKYESNDCAAAILSFSNYLSKYPTGAYAIAANYYRSDCYQKNKDLPNALIGYEFVNSKGNSKFFEKATLEAARISYFELKNYEGAKKYFESLRLNSVNQDNQLEALRGLVRCFYITKDYAQANTATKELLGRKGISTDDRSVSFLVLGKSQQLTNDCNAALVSFKSCAAINKSAWGAEARYELANCQFTLANYKLAEKAALATIKETGSYDEWVTKSYILLGDIFVQQKDYFNAKATYESITINASNADLKALAQQKLTATIELEKSQSKISN